MSTPRDQVPAGVAGWRLAVVLGVTAGCAIMYWLIDAHHNFFDLRIYLSAVRWWADGNDLYAYTQPDRLQGNLSFTYPPFAALLLYPLGFLPDALVFALFTAGTLIAVVVTVDWLVAPLARRWRQPRWFLLGLAAPLAVFIEPIRETISFGQLNMLLVILIMYDVLWAGPRGSRWAGVGIGIATAIKLIPGLFIAYALVTRQWRMARNAMLAAAAATLVAAAIAPRASWQYWTSALWDTGRVGRVDYTGNQSLLGLLARLTAPDAPSRSLWALLAVLVLGYAGWRLIRAGRAGQAGRADWAGGTGATGAGTGPSVDPVAGLALTGLASGLVSPITWPHHLYWFIPALVAVLATAVAAGQRAAAWWALVVGGYTICVLGVVSLVDWGVTARPTANLGDFLSRNSFVLLSLILVAVLPLRSRRDDGD